MTDLLLVVDMQEGFRSEESEDIVGKVAELVEGFKGEVVFSKFCNEEGSLFEEQLGWTRFQDEEDRRLLEKLRGLDGVDMVHDGYTVATDDLLEYLKENDVGRVYVCGVYTDVCIKKAAMDLFDRGFEVFVVEDCCASLHGEDVHKSAVESLKHILGDDHVLNSLSL